MSYSLLAIMSATSALLSIVIGGFIVCDASRQRDDSLRAHGYKLALLNVPWAILNTALCVWWLAS